jgi:hypothetical protein
MTARIIDPCGGLRVRNVHDAGQREGDNARMVNGQLWVIHGEASFSHWNLQPGQEFDNPSVRERLQALLGDCKRRRPPFGLRWLYTYLARVEHRHHAAATARQRAAERRDPRLARLMQWK